MRSISLLFGLFFLGFSLNAQSTDDPFTADVKNYFRAANFDKMYTATIDQVVDAMTTMYPEVTNEAWKEVRQKMKKNSIEELWTLLAPTYKKHFTHAEIKQILQFYNSPAGKKLSEKTMVLTNESMYAVEKWAQQLQPEIKDVLEEIEKN